MPCRCSDISGYRNEIQTVELIKRVLVALQNEVPKTDWSCAQIAQLADYALKHPNAQMAVGIKSLNEPVDFSLMISFCDTHISLLNTDISRMQQEDVNFHYL